MMAVPVFGAIVDTMSAHAFDVSRSNRPEGELAELELQPARSSTPKATGANTLFRMVERYLDWAQGHGFGCALRTDSAKLVDFHRPRVYVANEGRLARDGEGYEHAVHPDHRIQDHSAGRGRGAGREVEGTDGGSAYGPAGYLHPGP